MADHKAPTAVPAGAREEGIPRGSGHVVSVVGIVGIVMMVLATIIPLVVFITSFQYPRGGSAIASPLSYRNLPFPTVQPSVRSGEVIEVVVDRCNSEPLPLTFILTRSLMNVATGEEIVLTSVTTTAVAGCSSVISTLTTIPRGTPSGNYIITYLAHPTGTPWVAPVPSRTVVFEVRAP